jgi:hypothetical protein
VREVVPQSKIKMLLPKVGEKVGQAKPNSCPPSQRHPIHQLHGEALSDACLRSLHSKIRKKEWTTSRAAIQEAPPERKSVF